VYCFFDGCALGHQGSNGGPIHTGSQAFHNPFTFPSGKACRNFDQLALTCQENWAETLDLLQQGYLETFLGGLGRVDLALAAKEAARFPDRNRGLDQFLAKLPSEVVEVPKLEVDPREVNLGLLAVGEDRQLPLHMANQGMRLLYGSVTCDNCVWLAVGEAPGAPQKMFQFGGEQTIPIHVRGKHLRASNKLLEGRLLIESNGGTETVIVRAEVPVKPYPDGVLAGALSPRQIAEKAKTAPQEAAALFEKGAVAKWFEANGWIYPVKGPQQEGKVAVQQYFDALGLSRPIKLQISEQAVSLQGNVGVELRHSLEITTPEKRLVYAHATSDQPWLEVGRVRPNGRLATIPLVIPSVPDREGETLRAKVTVVGNGNQTFLIPVALEIGGSFNFGGPPGAATADAIVAPGENETLAFPAGPAIAEEKREEKPKTTPVALPAAPAKKWIHAAPAALLAVALALVVAWDIIRPPEASTEGIGAGGSLGVNVPLDDPEPRIGIKFNSGDRFGILMLKERDPKFQERYKQLTAKEDGQTNNTCIRIDGFENLFGKPPGEWMRDKSKIAMRDLPLGQGRHGWWSFWQYPRSNVRVRQTVEIIPNEQTHLLDTCLVHYLIENRDTVPHQIGLRVMLDTYIGANDGVPFVIPGQPGLLDTWKRFSGADIPDYIQALEKADLKDPGTIAHMGLKLQGIKIKPDDPELDPLESLLICRWPGTTEKTWDWEPKAMNDKSDGPDAQPDSCVVLYWKVEEMAPESKRAMAFTYGLGKVASTDAGELGLTLGGSFRPGRAFTVTAYVKNAKPGQKVKLILPVGLSLDDRPGTPKQSEELVIDKGSDLGQVSWRVLAGAEGEYHVEVVSGTFQASQLVRIRKPGLFD
jgi:hypothetical protein